MIRSYRQFRRARIASERANAELLRVSAFAATFSDAVHVRERTRGKRMENSLSSVSPTRGRRPAIFRGASTFGREKFHMGNHATSAIAINRRTFNETFDPRMKRALSFFLPRIYIESSHTYTWPRQPTECWPSTVWRKFITCTNNPYPRLLHVFFISAKFLLIFFAGRVLFST